MNDVKWSVLMTDSAPAGAGGLSPTALAMLEVEAELTAKGIPVGWDPYRPGEGFEGFHVSFAFPRPLHMLVRESDASAAVQVLRDLGLDADV